MEQQPRYSESFVASLEARIAELEAENRELKDFNNSHVHKIKKLEKAITVEGGRLGAYLNTMVSDLGIDGEGQYLRNLFGKFKNELQNPGDT